MIRLLLALVLIAAALAGGGRGAQPARRRSGGGNLRGRRGNRQPDAGRSSSAAGTWRSPATAPAATPHAVARPMPAAPASTRPSAPSTPRTSRPTRQPASATGAPRISGAPCTTGARATAACSIRCSPTRTTPASRARIRMPSTPGCVRSRRSSGRTRRTRSALPVRHAGCRSPSGARCSSSRARTSRKPAGRPQWNRGAYLVNGLGHCNACHSGPQPVRRHQRHARPQRRPDPDAELVRAVARGRRRGRRRRLGGARHRRPARQRVSRRALGDRADGRRGLPQHAAPVGDRSRSDCRVPEGPAAGRRPRRSAPASSLGRASDATMQQGARSTRHNAPAATATTAKGICRRLPAARGQSRGDDGSAGQPGAHRPGRRLSRRQPRATRGRSACRPTPPC